jgi:hypothetical protein
MKIMEDVCPKEGAMEGNCWTSQDPLCVVVVVVVEEEEEEEEEEERVWEQVVVA